jgi:hypothetical protein
MLHQKEKFQVGDKCCNLTNRRQPWWKKEWCEYNQLTP